MRAVNLLPEEDRPRRASGTKPGSAYAIIGVLVVLLGMVSVYVLTSNQVSAHKADAAAAKRDTALVQARISRLGAFGNFNQIKQTRVASVKSLAQARFDWERFVRELALVLPRGTWLSEVDAVSSAGAGTAAPVAATPDASTSPNAKLKGCAPHQPDVAKLMVRLRKMNRVKDVELTESARQVGSGAGAPSVPSTPSPSGPSAADPGECTGYQFDVVVQFADPVAAPPAQTSKRVPASLGGGA